MPLARYFFSVGGVFLLVECCSRYCLFRMPICSNCRLPTGQIPICPVGIHSDRKWPERVVYNTNLPAIIPAHIANTDSLPAAQLQPSDANQLQPSDPKKREPTLQRKRKIAKRRAAPPTIRLAQRPQFGFVGEASGE